jgi:dihydrofolate synthase/folylpolyglutamate synthase
MLNTKDVPGFLAAFGTDCASLTAITIPNEPNAVPAADLATAGRACGITSFEGTDMDEVLRGLSQRHPEARILICGSLYLAGHVLRKNDKSA